jgi:hypothetical protein
VRALRDARGSPLFATGTTLFPSHADYFAEFTRILIAVDIGLLERTRELLAMVETRSPAGALWIVEAGRVRIHLANGDE